MVSQRQRLFLLLSAMMSFFFSMQFASNSLPLAETDEGPHLSYAAVLADGELPTIETPLVREPGTLPGEYLQRRQAADQAHNTIWVANHPPGFYAVAVPEIWLANAISSPATGLFLLRMLNAALTASLVVLAGLFARALLPRQPSALYVAAAVQVAMSAITFDAGAVYNDGMAAALVLLAILLAVRCLRHGLTTSRVWWLAGVCAAAALTRSPGVVATALCAVAVVAAGWIHRIGPRWRRRALCSGLVVAVVPALCAGWFYVRNWLLYGDPTASEYLVNRFDRRERIELLEPGRMVRYWAQQWPRLFVERRVTSDMQAWRIVITVVGVIAVLGLLLRLVHAIRGRWVARKPGPTPLGSGERRTEASARPGLAGAWMLSLVYVAVTIAATLQFLVSGAGSHERYLLPMTSLIAVITAAGLLGTVAFARRPFAAQILAARATVLFFLVWAVLIQVPTAIWAAGRFDERRMSEALGGRALPFVFQALGALAAVGAVVVARKGLAELRHRTVKTVGSNDPDTAPQPLVVTIPVPTGTAPLLAAPTPALVPSRAAAPSMATTPDRRTPAI